MVKFGPSGNDLLFYEEGNKKSVEAPKWIKSKGLDLYEYSFGRGYRMSYETAENIGEEAKKQGIEISLHAPYFVNFGNPTSEAREKSIQYVIDGLIYLRKFGGNKLVVHPGSQLKQTREVAMKNAIEGIKELVQRIYAEGLDDMYVCFETMGKKQQLGTVDEIIEICKIDKILIPTVDFGHVNAVTGGSLKSKDDYEEIINKIVTNLGFEKANKMHIHFSKIEYTEKGEKMHLTLEDKIYGPEFEGLAQVLKEKGLSPTIICESKEIMAQDAMKLKEIYKKV